MSRWRQALPAEVDSVGEKLALFVVVVIVCAWVTSTLILPVVIKGYAPPPEMNTVIGIVAGGAAAMIFAKRGNGGKDRP